jgi:capsular polysaccharide biosynthesis protein
MLADVSIEWNKIPEDHGIMRRFFLPEAETLEGTSLLLASTGGGTYHHWMMDVLTRFPFLEQSGRELTTIDHFLVNGVDLPFQKDALLLLGIPLNKCVVLNKRRRIRCARLLVPSLSFPTSRPSREACGFLGTLFPKQGSEPARGRLLVGRSGGVSRQVQRWEEIRNKLLPLGFVEFDPGQASLKEQAAAFRGAGIVVGAHGAALTNLVFCQPGTRVLEMFGADYVNPCYRNLCAAAGLEHHAVVDVVGTGQTAQLELIDATREIRGEPGLVAELAEKLLRAG